MKEADDIDRDLDRLVQRLPEALRRDWAVVPRRFLVQVALVGALLGAALALGVAGLVLEVEALKWAWPAVLGALYLATKWAPWWRGDRFEAQLRSLREDSRD